MNKLLIPELIQFNSIKELNEFVENSILAGTTVQILNEHSIIVFRSKEVEPLPVQPVKWKLKEIK